MTLRRIDRWLSAAVLLAVMACAPRAGDDLRPSVEQLVAVMANLHIPPGWELISEEVVAGPCFDPVERCPEVSRVYQLEDDPGFQEDVIAMFAAAGMEPGPFHIDTCDPPKNACSVSAHVGNISGNATVTDIEDDTLTVVLFLS